MSLSMYADEQAKYLDTFAIDGNVEPGAFKGMLGAGAKLIPKVGAQIARGASLLGAPVPIALDAMSTAFSSAPKSTVLQDMYFGATVEPAEKAVERWTPAPHEVGWATEAIYSVFGTIAPILLAPIPTISSLAVDTAREVHSKPGVSLPQALGVGAVAGLSQYAGVKATLWGRGELEAIGIAAGFNWAQGIATRGAQHAILSGTEVQKSFEPFGLKEQAIDVLLSIAMTPGFRRIKAVREEGQRDFYSIEQGLKRWYKGDEGKSPFEADLSPAAKAVTGAMREWAENAKPSDVDALLAVRQARHLAVDSLPGRPSSPASVEAHVTRVREVIGQMLTGEEINIPPVPRETLVRPAGEHTVNGEPGFRLKRERDTGTKVYEKDMPDGTTRTVAMTNDGMVAGDTTTHGTFTINGSYLDEGALQVRVQTDNKTGKRWAHVLDEQGQPTQTIELTPRTEGMPIEQALETDFSDAGGIAQDGTTTPHTTTVERQREAPYFVEDPERAAFAAEQVAAMREAAVRIAAEEGLPEGPSILLPIEDQLKAHFMETGYRKADGTWHKMDQAEADEYIKKFAALDAVNFRAFSALTGGKMTPEQLLNRYLADVKMRSPVPAGALEQRLTPAQHIADYKPMVEKSEYGGTRYRNKYLDLGNSTAYGKGEKGERRAFRIMDKSGAAADVGFVILEIDSKGKFAALRNIEIRSDIRTKGLGENVVATLVAHNGPGYRMDVVDITHGGHVGTDGDALPFWQKMGTQLKNYSREPSVQMDGMLSLEDYLGARSGQGTAAGDRGAAGRNLPANRGTEGTAGSGMSRGGPTAADRAELARLNGTSLFQGQPWYHSALSRAIDNVPTKAQPAKGWKDWLKGQIQKGAIKADEVKYTGLEEYLDLQPGKITKEQLQTFMQEGGVRVEDVELGGKDAEAQRTEVQADADAKAKAFFDMIKVSVDVKGQKVWPDELYYSMVDGDTNVADLPPEMQVAAQTWLDAYNRLKNFKPTPADPARFAGFQLPGAKEGSYRELALVLPGKKPLKYVIAKAKSGDYIIVSDDGERVIGNYGDDYMAASQELGRLEGEIKKANATKTDYRVPQGHSMGDKADINRLAHIRFNERAGPNGERVLFIEEIQSDWAQQGKKQGFQHPEPSEAELRQMLNDAGYDTNYNGVNWVVFSKDKNGLVPNKLAGGEDKNQFAANLAQVTQMVLGRRDLRPGMQAVPSGPFVGKTDAWVALSLKRMIRYAAENGFDQIAWTTGAQQAERYDLSKQVQSLSYFKNKAGAYEIKVIPVGRGTEWQTVARDVPPEKLEDYVGKETAQKIIDGAGNKAKTGDTIMTGIDLKIGGEGMKGFYDKIVPTVAKDVLKKLGGGKVETVQIGTGRFEIGGNDRDGWFMRDPEGGGINGFATRELAQQAALAARPSQSGKSEVGEQMAITITPEMRTKAMESQALFQPAYHGTPHNIGPEGFSTSKIGTGEGAQAYGWGLYFAENPEVAKEYSRNVEPPPGTPPIRSFRGERLEPGSPAYHAATLLSSSGVGLASARREVRGWIDHARQGEDVGHYKAVLAVLDSATSKSEFKEHPHQGSLYQVDIPDEHAAKMLLWDKPLSEQPEAVREALRTIPELREMATKNAGEDDALLAALDQPTGAGAADLPGITGEQLYHKIENILMDRGVQSTRTDEAASKYLAELGVPGIKYLDAGSRNRPLREIKKEFMSELPEDAEFEDVTSLIGKGTFSPKNEAILKALEADDWLGFDYPAQALSAALSKDVSGFDVSPELRRAIDAALEDGTHNLVVFDDKIIKITHKDGSPVTQAERDAYLQKQQPDQGGVQQDQARGYLSIDSNRQMTMGFLESTDPSTPIHERAHFFLEMLDDLAAEHPLAEQEMQVLFKDWGITREQWNGMDLNGRRQYHENFADSWMVYLATNKAPTPELRSVFRRFRDWLLSVFESAQTLNIKVSAEMREFFDRLHGSQMLDPSTDPAAKAAASGPPPPPQPGVESQRPPGTVDMTAGADEYVPKTLDDQDMREHLRNMVESELGWAEVGGKMIRMPMGDGEPDKITRTQWIPKAEWWAARPANIKALKEADYEAAVAKALVGDPLKPIEQRAVDFMMQVANERMRAEQAIGRDEWNNIAKEVLAADLEPTTRNVLDADAVAIANQIDEGMVERLAIQYDADDAGFMAEIRRMIDDHQNPEAAAGGQEAVGQAQEGVPAARPAAQPGPEASAKAAGSDGVDLLAQEADRFVLDNPDLTLEFEMPDGSTQKMTAAQYLADVRESAAMARDDIRLIHEAAQCLLGAA